MKYNIRLVINMVSKKNKKGRYSEPLSSSKEDWETRGKRKGNSAFKKVRVKVKGGGTAFRYKLRHPRKKQPRKGGRKK